MKVEELGSLRLNIVYTEDHVFPSEYYTPLRDLLLHSANVEVHVSVSLLSSDIFSVLNRSLLVLFYTSSLCECYMFTPPLTSLFSPCRRPQLTFWGRCVERNKKLPSPWCVCFFTMARLCLSSAPSLTPKSTAHSECLVTAFTFE